MRTAGARSDAHRTAERHQVASLSKNNFFFLSLSGPAAKVLRARQYEHGCKQHGDNARHGMGYRHRSPQPLPSGHILQTFETHVGKPDHSQPAPAHQNRLSLTTRSNIPHARLLYLPHPGSRAHPARAPHPLQGSPLACARSTPDTRAAARDQTTCSALHPTAREP